MKKLKLKKSEEKKIKSSKSKKVKESILESEVDPSPRSQTLEEIDNILQPELKLDPSQTELSSQFEEDDMKEKFTVKIPESSILKILFELYKPKFQNIEAIFSGQIVFTARNNKQDFIIETKFKKDQLLNHYFHKSTINDVYNIDSKNMYGALKGEKKKGKILLYINKNDPKKLFLQNCGDKTTKRSVLLESISSQILEFPEYQNTIHIGSAEFSKIIESLKNTGSDNIILISNGKYIHFKCDSNSSCDSIIGDDRHTRNAPDFSHMSEEENQKNIDKGIYWKYTIELKFVTCLTKLINSNLGKGNVHISCDKDLPIKIVVEGGSVCVSQIFILPLEIQKQAEEEDED